MVKGEEKVSRRIGERKEGMEKGKEGSKGEEMQCRREYLKNRGDLG